GSVRRGQSRDRARFALRGTRAGTVGAYGDTAVRGSPVAPAVLRRELASNRRYAGRRARRQSFGRRARETRTTVVRCGARCLDEAICADAPVAVPTTD